MYNASSATETTSTMAHVQQHEAGEMPKIAPPDIILYQQQFFCLMIGKELCKLWFSKISHAYDRANTLVPQANLIVCDPIKLTSGLHFCIVKNK